MTPAASLPRLAISVRQPWAWALLNGKHVENRTAGSVRFMHAQMKPGPQARLALHAAQGLTRAEYERARGTIDSILGDGACPRPDQLIRGAIIGQVCYVELISESTSPWFFGPKGLVFEQAVAIDPIPCAGELGFFDWRDRVVDAVQAPKPWMRAWPGLARPSPAPKPIDPPPEDGPLLQRMKPR